MLDKFIRAELKKKEILLMTHLVLGFPSFTANRAMVQAMSDAGVELIELQIPFSEPIADGPTMIMANSESLQNGTTVAQCFEFAQSVVKEFPKIRFLFMTYFNIPFVCDENSFLDKMKEIGVKGTIIPDLPYEEARTWLAGCRKHKLANIFIFTPTHSDERLQELGLAGQGFIYCVGRRGVTGNRTDFNPELAKLIKRYRQATPLPIALGFGVQDKKDVDFLVGKSDIAVIGSKLIQLQLGEGIPTVAEFLNQLR